MNMDAFDYSKAQKRKIVLEKIELDTRVKIEHNQVEKIAKIIEGFPLTQASNFVGDYLPPINHPLTLDYFFSVILQQFGFWESRHGHYDRPLFATLDGKKMKGSTYLFYAYTRLLDSHPTFFSPHTQANLRITEFKDIFRDDNGVVQMPAIEIHLEQAKQYGRDMLELGLTPVRILQHAQRSGKVLSTFLVILDHLGGYKEDPLRKKPNLLALCLSQRPEAFLKFSDNETIDPIVDYHCMRSILRTGMIEVVDKKLLHKLTNRLILNPEDEWAIRLASYKVIQKLVTLSAKPVSVVDQFLFRHMRSHCPEMSEPNCSECVLDEICAKHKKMFQPVIRTTFY